MFSEIRRLMEQSRPVSAWKLWTEKTTVPNLADPDALILSSRLAWQLGGRRRSAWWIRQGWNRFPNHADTRYYRALQVYERRGPYGCWEFLQAHTDTPDNETADTRSSWLALHGQAAAALRDFDQAETWYQSAIDVNGLTPWLRVCRAFGYECEDRYDDAMSMIDEALSENSRFRPALQAKAHLLILRDEVDQAVDFMKNVIEQTELGVVAAHCCAVLMERRRFEEAPALLARYRELSPLLEKPAASWIASQEYELAYQRGDFSTAIEYAKRADSPYMKRIAERLSQPENLAQPRIQLDLPFVRQHHKTCVPATLSSIAKYWSMAVDHVQLADEICYDGTTAYAERHWAATSGWFTREFTVTSQATRELIEAGIPFTLTTVGAGNAHLQAVCGFDGRCGTILIRDPFIPYVLEAQVDEFLKDQVSTGPRGMALVPLAERERLESLELPDAEIWEVRHALDGHLESHRRSEAGETLDELMSRWPDHRLTLEAERRVAYYDGNAHAQRQAVERL
ncbi:MAG: C39 family peptidase [Pirellulaceae bacterium]